MGYGSKRLAAQALAAGAAVGLAGVAAGQDSTAASFGLPGDAVNAYAVGASGEQVNNYVVDLTPRLSSWGGRYAVGPVLKSSRSSTSLYFDHLIGASGASQRFVPSPLLRASYSIWSGPGAGINATDNTPPGALNTAGLSGYRAAGAFMEFGAGPDGNFGTADDENNVIVGVLEMLPARPNRLLVSRIVAITNKTGPTTGNSATAGMGLGSVDAGGQVHLLADGYGSTSPLRIQNKQYVRVNAAARNPALVNRIQQGSQGDAGATAIVLNSTTPLTTPGMIPSAVAGRPVLLGTDFVNNLHFEQTQGSTTTTKAYLPGQAGSPRGGVSVLAHPFAPLGNGTADAGLGATLVRTDGDTRTRGVQFFGLNTDGSVDGQLQVTLPNNPSLLIDLHDGFAPGAVFAGLGDHEFTGYQSQASFRGGNGQVAMAVLSDGDLLAAALVSAGPVGGGGSVVPAGEDNYIAVLRVDSATSAQSWSVAAHTGDSSGASGGLSKAIFGDLGADGIPGTGDAGEGDGVVDFAAPIGRLALASEVGGFFTQTGPSLSAPAMDRAGNIYFVANVELNTAPGLGTPEHTQALIRANRSSQPGGEAFRLEVLLKVGDVTIGANSGVPYQVQFLGVADGDSIDSGSLWSGSIVHDSVPWGNAAAAPYGSPFALGTLLVRAKIVYDTDGDGQFADPSGGGNSPDEAYNVLLAVMPEVHPADFNRDGSVSVQDIYDFLFAWTNGSGDYNGADGTTVQDIYDFLSVWSGS